MVDSVSGSVTSPLIIFRNYIRPHEALDGKTSSEEYKMQVKKKYLAFLFGVVLLCNKLIISEIFLAICLY
jgi:hypothetical protein